MKTLTKQKIKIAAQCALAAAIMLGSLAYTMSALAGTHAAVYSIVSQIQSK